MCERASAWSCQDGARRATAAILALAAIFVALPGPPRAQEITKRRGFSIKLTQPVSKDFVFGKTKLAAEVKIDRPEAVEKVEFFVSDTLVFIDQEPPYECFYDFGKEAKEVVIRVVAYHREGVTVSDFAVTRKIDLAYAVRVNRVILNASVFDKEGNFVTGLGKDDFLVSEGGASRSIIDFAPEARPILMALLLDVSGSMQEKMAVAQKAASGFVDTLRATDRAMLVEFNEKVYMLSDLSSDTIALKRLIESTKALGGTALYDALHVTLRRLAQYDARKVIVVLSDGDDSNSQTDFDKVLKEAKAGDVGIFVIALGGGFSVVDSRGKMKDLAEQTGARYFSASKASDLEGVYQKIADELRNQYAITYASENEKFDGRWIPITIEAQRKDLLVRSRKGYFAVPRPEGF